MQSWDQGFGNVCILEKVLENIPKTNTLFFNFGNNWGFSELLDTYTKELVSNGFSVVSPTIDTADTNKLHVSKKMDTRLCMQIAFLLAPFMKKL